MNNLFYANFILFNILNFIFMFQVKGATLIYIFGTKPGLFMDKLNVLVLQLQYSLLHKIISLPCGVGEQTSYETRKLNNKSNFSVLLNMFIVTQPLKRRRDPNVVSQ